MPAPRRRSVRPAANPYSVHPSLEMVRKAVADLRPKTGRTLDEWLAFINAEGPPGEAARREWLKSRHGLGTRYAWWLSGWSLGKGTEDLDPGAYLAAAVRYVDAMLAGKRAALRPIYDRLLALGLSMGRDVRACPCQTIVPLYRRHVFAQIKPATNSRIDLGLALGAMKTPARLLPTGGLEKKDRITHRIPISSLDQVDEEVNTWLRRAYDRDA